MTPLHILCFNPNVTLAMIRELASKCPTSALVRNRENNDPVDIYLFMTDFEPDRIYNGHEIERTSFLLKDLSDFYLRRMIKSDLYYDLVELLLTFKGLSLDSIMRSGCSLPYEKGITSSIQLQRFCP